MRAWARTTPAGSCTRPCWSRPARATGRRGGSGSVPPVRSSPRTRPPPVPKRRHSMRPSGPRPAPPPTCRAAASQGLGRCAHRAGFGSRRTRTRPPRCRARTRSSPRAGSAPAGCSSVRISTAPGRSSTTRGCSTSAASSPPPTWCWPGSSAAANPASRSPCTPVPSRSAGGSTCPATRRANTPPSRRRSAGKRSFSATGSAPASTPSTKATAQPGSPTTSGLPLSPRAGGI